MPRGNQLARQWQLLQLIDHPAGIAVEDAGRKLDCTVRTIWRDLEVLERAGFPLYSDREADGRRSIWKLQEDFKLGMLVKLSLAETAALVMSRDLLGPAGGRPRHCPYFGLRQIGHLLSRDALRPLDEMRESISGRDGAHSGAEAGERRVTHLPNGRQNMIVGTMFAQINADKEGEPRDGRGPMSVLSWHHPGDLTNCALSGVVRLGERRGSQERSFFRDANGGGVSPATVAPGFFSVLAIAAWTPDSHKLLPNVPTESGRIDVQEALL